MSIQTEDQSPKTPDKCRPELATSDDKAQGPVAGMEDLVKRIPELVSDEVVNGIIGIQVNSIDRLESTNKSLLNCSTLAQKKLATTTKLFKKTAKQLEEAKKDMDVIYKKILELKAKIRAERPDYYRDRAPDHSGRDQTS